MRLSTLILLTFLLSCQPSSTKDDGVTQSTKIADNTTPVDTLNDPTHFYYLIHLPLRKVGELILLDSIMPSDNKITFDCMDSLSSTDKESREFYFPVFLKIISKSDGALSEAVGQYAMKYVEQFPEEFLKKSKALTDTEFYNWANYIGYEFYFSDETEKAALNWTNTAIKKCSSCDSIEKNKFARFADTVIATMKQAHEN